MTSLKRGNVILVPQSEWPGYKTENGYNGWTGTVTNKNASFVYVKIKGDPVIYQWPLARANAFRRLAVSTRNAVKPSRGGNVRRSPTLSKSRSRNASPSSSSWTSRRTPNSRHNMSNDDVARVLLSLSRSHTSSPRSSSSTYYRSKPRKQKRF